MARAKDSMDCQSAEFVLKKAMPPNRFGSNVVETPMKSSSTKFFNGRQHLFYRGWISDIA